MLMVRELFTDRFIRIVIRSSTISLYKAIPWEVDQVLRKLILRVFLMVIEAYS